MAIALQRKKRGELKGKASVAAHTSLSCLRKFCKDGSCTHQDCEEVISTVAIIPSKRLRNKIAGFSTHLMKRIQKGPVRGISLKLQEEERERRMDFVPDESAIKTDLIEVDKETLDMLSALGMSDLPGVVKQAAEPQAVAALPTYGRGAGGFGRKY
ncbi:hypothetical protein K7X08_017130 [Anisodus acutangulus]|uniref:40S ribosomal protein S17 n=1 Tax=Anisodus acutangulus TaxID=402998 RepID=A0A9Q1LRU8_9SOLA|nr:hypothetical protein K7X08_017130 [Anisodus acutangulus]